MRGPGGKHPLCVLSTALEESLALPDGVTPNLDPCQHFITVHYAVDVVDVIILELVVSVASPAQLLCSGMHCFFRHCGPQRVLQLVASEQRWSILGKVQRRGVGFCTERLEMWSTPTLRKCMPAPILPGASRRAMRRVGAELKSQGWVSPSTYLVTLGQW